MKRLPIWIALAALALFAATGTALAQDHDDHDRGHDQDHGNVGQQHRDPHAEHHEFTGHDHDAMQNWYHSHQKHLPRGLARRDFLPGNLEARLVVHAELIPELRHRFYPLPGDFVALLPPAPYGCEYVALGGHVVLIDIGTFYVYDIFRF